MKRRISLCSSIVLLSLIYSLSAQALPLNLDTLGEQKTAVILLNLTSESENLYPKNQIDEVFFTGQYSINNFIKEASYNKAWISGEVFGWYHWPQSGRCRLKTDELFNLIKNDMRFKNYDRFFFLYNRDLNACAGHGFGESTHGKVNIVTSQGTIRASMSRVAINYRLAKPTLPFQPLNGVTGSVIAHEFGHALGILGHANLYECGNKSISKNPQDCNQEAIADMFSIMSGESYHRTSLHMSACHKKDLGWLGSQQLVTINAKSTPRTIKVKLGAYENAKSQIPMAVQIHLDKPLQVVKDKVYLSSLFLEYRTPQGFNRRLQELDQPLKLYRSIQWTDPNKNSPLAIDYRGIQIRGGFYKDGHCVTSYLMDAKPNTLAFKTHDYSLYDHLDAFVNVGEVFNEPNNNIQIKVISLDKDRVTLEVSI